MESFMGQLILDDEIDYEAAKEYLEERICSFVGEYVYNCCPKEYRQSDEWKKKISNSLKGKPKSKEAIEKSRLSKIGKPAWNKGKHNIYNDKQLAKMSENTKKLWEKEEYRNRCKIAIICERFYSQIVAFL